MSDLLNGGATGDHYHVTSTQAAWASAMATLNQSLNVALWSDPTDGSRCLAVKMLNGTGGATTKGYIISASTAANATFSYTQVDSPDPCGIVLEDSVANGEYCWIAVSGLAKVYFGGDSTRGHFARVTMTADGYSAGQAISEPYPSSPFATDKHFMEIGHVFEARTGAGLALVMLHFN
jgi:hypothetical protein